MDEEYTKRLEHVIKQMLQPLKNIPFNLVIEAISGKKIIPFDSNDKKDQDVLKLLIKVAGLAGLNINKEGIKKSRPNEVGNAIESFVRQALNECGYKSSIPASKDGKKKAVGYPDIEFIDIFGRINYLECKTYNIKSINSSLRSFYLSPSKQFKITHEAHHFVLSYEIYKESSNVYKCKNWKILSVEKLLVDVKYEFNSDNRRLYLKELILAEGEVKNSLEKQTEQKSGALNKFFS